ncbi:16S rRNA (cytosine(967)-C(5))-methyltransferase RsmB [Clostridium rectalis]|uniref:16S rRNA (cytosine(967)-C(5))-methyltransferase RsmB n=1 Tax=Clostridium rectalis TaxID=2040295 RepID=UPI000F630B83|nr:16S rRNA (cytosine(967)-C(5))-methyltransferase RsmB [Clostridium rectalis]
MDNSRKIAVEILNDVINKNAYSNIVLNNKLNNSNLFDIDKGLTTEIVYGTLKYMYSIDKMLDCYLKNGIKKLDEYILNILRIGIYQLNYLDKIPEFAAVNECVELAKERSKGGSKLVNGVLRNFLRNKNKIYYKNTELDKVCFEYSFPKWLTQLFIKQYGIDDAIKILYGLNQVPTVTVRVNNLKGDYEDIWRKLIENGYNIEQGSVCPEAIKIVRGKNIENNPIFKEGLITVQDESAMLVASTMEIEDNIYVLDLCSAPGGKTTHIAELLDNTGSIFAFDIHKNKLSLVKDNASRLGIKNIHLNVMDACIYKEKYKEFADRILIDVPCSGLGIIRKKPEIKYTKNKNDLKSIIQVQRKILLNASKYVKNNGIILYSTCTLNKEENEENIKWFIKEHPEFKIEPIFYGNLENIKYDNMGTVTILPDKSMDGFFIAKLKKQW